MKLNRKDQIENTLKACNKIADSPAEVYHAWNRLRLELEFLSNPEGRNPRFCHLLNAIWIAASNDQT